MAERLICSCGRRKVSVPSICEVRRKGGDEHFGNKNPQSREGDTVSAKESRF